MAGLADLLAQNPAHPPEAWNRGVRNVMGGIGNALANAFKFPGQYASGQTGYQPGQMASEQPQATQWAPEMAMNMTGAPALTGGVPGLGIGIGKGRTVKPSPDDVYEVAKANFSHGALAGNRTLPIDKMSGGVAMNDPTESARVRALADKIKSPEGYISRPIVDDAGNVIEGQHRLEALRMLGEKTVPVTMVNDLARGVDTKAMADALRGQKLHPDQVNGVIQSALEAAHSAGGAEKALAEYALPGFQSAFETVLRSMIGGR